MGDSILKDVVLPLALVLIMLGMGLSLKASDFARIFKYPKAVAVGVGFQMLALPVVGLLLVKVFALPPALGVGLMILALSPGGATSNMLSYLARGDLALSVTLTAVVSVVTPITIPLLGNMMVVSLMGQEGTVELPFWITVAKLVGITLVPVGIGMVIYRYAPRAAGALEKPVKIFSIVFLFAIIAGLLKQNWADVPTWLAACGPATLCLNLVTMTMGFLGAKALKLDRPQCATIGIEVGIQNGTLALVVTGMLGGGQLDMAPAVYSLIMFLTGGVFAVVVARGIGPKPSVATS